MPNFDDLVSVVRGPIRGKPLVAIWALPPATAGVVGGVPDMIRFYFDIDERLRSEMQLRALLPEVLILPGFWPSLGVVVEASAFGGQIVWSRSSSPHIYPRLKHIDEVDSLATWDPGASAGRDERGAEGGEGKAYPSFHWDGNNARDSPPKRPSHGRGSAGMTRCP